MIQNLSCVKSCVVTNGSQYMYTSFCLQAAKEYAKKLEDENALKEREYSEEVHLAWHQLALMIDVVLYLTANFISSNVICMFYIFKRHAKRKRKSLK
jgi:hypothetical protein